MDRSDLSRRDFNKLTMAAFGGVLAGAAAGCGEADKGKPTAPTGSTGGKPADSEKKSDPDVASADGKEVHLCRGLNTCKGKGADGKNECAGQGECATAKHHACGGDNECKGLGGCGEDVGQNECKTKGGCHVPLMDFAWEKARKRLADKMKAEDKPLGEAPPKKKS